MYLALCGLSRSDLGWASACVFGSSKTRLRHHPPHRCLRQSLLLRRLPGLVPRLRRRFAPRLLASRSCEPSLMSRAVWGTPPWLLLLELNAHASTATDVRKTCEDVPAIFDAHLPSTRCPSYHAMYAYLPSVCAVMLSSEAVALHPLRGASGSALCSARGLPVSASTMA